MEQKGNQGDYQKISPQNSVVVGSVVGSQVAHWISVGPESHTLTATAALLGS